MVCTRCFDTPLSEGGIVAAAIGMAAYGLRPVIEIQFADYILPAYDQLVSEAARLRYRSAGEFSAPMVVRSPYGGGIFGGQTHSQSPEALFAHVSGLKTVIPSNPYDAKGLLISAIRDPDPVIFLEPKRIYTGPFDGHHDRPLTPWSKHPASEVPEDYYTVPLGQAAIVRPGSALTLLAYGTMVHVALAAVERQRHRCRSDRRAHDRAARHRHDRAIGEPDRTLRDRARGDAHLRLRRRARGAGRGALFLSSRGAHRARHRIRHAVSACVRVGIFHHGPQRVVDAMRRAMTV